MKVNGQKPICQYPAGSRVFISDLCESKAARCRLCALGLLPGTEVEILSTAGGSCRLRVKDSDMVLDADMAASIMAVATPDRPS